MTVTTRAVGVIVVCVSLFAARRAAAQDWPQWRGPNRDAKAEGFNAPTAWPAELKKKWSIPIGDGVASPALVGDRLYVFSRQDPNEIIRCLSAANGDEIWQEKYASEAATGNARSFPGPRSSPTVADGRIFTLSVQGALSCRDATNGKELWNKKDVSSVPRFFTSCSPIVVDGLCIVQLGGENGGAIVAYDAATGAQKWKWADEGTAYASPVLFAADSSKAIVAETARNIVGISLEGKLLWTAPFPAGAGRSYNACTPIVDGQTVIFSGAGRGTKAVKIEKEGDKLVARDAWSVKDNGVQFNSPIIKNGLVFGISSADVLFCVRPATNEVAWTNRFQGGNGYGSVVDVGPALLGLNPAGKLIVFEPSDKAYKEIASYQVADGGTYAYPIPSGNRIFIKDKNNITLWTVE